MPTKKSKKCHKFRGHGTHGCGSMKKRRGSGNRGGFGMAGTGKRAGQKKPTILLMYGNSYYGKHGFKRPQKITGPINTKIINIESLERSVENWLVQGLVKQESGFIVINLTELGYSKLLSKGNASRKYKITVNSATENAQEKIKEVGGEIILPQ
jgi:large subunit ribosomal protein L15